MINYLFIILGFAIVIYALFRIFAELKNYDHLHDYFTKGGIVVDRVEEIREEIDEINSSYYEISDELLDRIEELENKITRLEDTIRTGNLNRINIDVEDVLTFDSKDDAQKEDSKDNNTRILELSNLGFKPSKIARELEIGIGEVMLILNMKKK